jgi:riboflavin kinase/FMN adenylyltransferase
MSIINDLKRLEKPLNNAVLTIGNFDGVHKGHLVLFDKVKERAKAIKGQSAVMTFEPHPIKVIKPGNGPPLITQTEQKLKLISEANIDVIFCLPFSHEFASISAEDFVHDILLNTIGIKEIVVGYDYSFGSRRQGDTNLLRKMGNELGFEVHIVEPIYLDSILVSSTSIRDFVKEGNISDAKHLLGRYYQVAGKVVKGADRGKKLLGTPTANLDPFDELIPKNGVYSVTVEAQGKSYFGVCNIGYNPTFGENALSIEPHLFNFEGDLIGKIIKINFIKRLRDERKFKSPDELSTQIEKDIQQTKELFGLHE